MEQIIKKFTNGASLEYGNGSFDEWCVYLTALVATFMCGMSGEKIKGLCEARGF